MEDEDGDREGAEEDRRQYQSEKKSSSSFVIEIPSYQQVIKPTQSQPTPSLFTPSPSFSQAFNFIKNSEFYSPPPPPAPPSTAAPQPSHTSAAAASSSSRPLGNEQGVPSSSSSAVASSLTTTQIANNRNAILVSHRQGNPLLKHIRNVRWAFADVVCDYTLGQSTCALYLRF